MDSKFITAKTNEGLEIKCDGETWATGQEVYTEVDGKKTPLANGDYSLENGSVLKVADGKITEVVEAEEQEADKVIQSAMSATIQKLEARLKSLEESNTKLSEKNVELETKLSNLPGQKQEEKKDEKKILTRKQALEVKLGILRKKDTEVSKNKK